MDREGDTLQSVFRTGFLILLFEFCGTIMLTVFQRMIPGLGFVFAYWWIVVICENISGSHFNPAVTLTFMLRKDKGRFHWPLGFAYIIVQFIGAFCGALIAYLFTKDGGMLGIGEKYNDDSYIFQAVLSETFGSFLYIFVFLIQTEKSTKCSQDLALWSLVIAAALGSVITYNGFVTGSMNPAYCFGVAMTMIMNGRGNHIKFIWIFLIFPFVGGILSLLFYEFVYKKTQVMVEEDYQHRTTRRQGRLLEDE
ncbi:unnamed protein product [Moneuplotes crassus]|uniref:Aquaporin n=1 Tax=Euplotes crassus TaxID=5936 RepID=A0AAD1XLU4_EUPCR|nr:unnamed protein product [Moneuplotes crassus]